MPLTEQQIANDLSEIITYHKQAIEKAEILLQKLNRKPRVKKITERDRIGMEAVARRMKNLYKNPRENTL